MLEEEEGVLGSTAGKAVPTSEEEPLSSGVSDVSTSDDDSNSAASCRNVDNGDDGSGSGSGSGVSTSSVQVSAVPQAAAKSSEDEQESSGGEEATEEMLINAFCGARIAKGNGTSSSEEDSAEEAVSATEVPFVVDCNDGWGMDTAGGRGGKRRGRARRQQPAAASRPPPSEPAPEEAPLLPSDLHCSICGAGFATRNKLFAHIKATGHAVVLHPMGQAAAGVPRPGAGGRRRR